MKSALIGYGYWGKILRQYIENDDNFELIKICSNKFEYEINTMYINNLDNILLDSQIEVVFVCTPIATHLEICKKLLSHGKHVFCEKPTVRKNEQLNILLDISKKNSKILFTDYIYTVSNSIKKMKELMTRIGDISFIQGEISQFGNFYPEDTVFEVIGVHLISVLAYFFPNILINKCDFLNYDRVSLSCGHILLNINENINVLFLCNLLNAKKARVIKIYGTLGNIIFDMMDENATLQFIGYKEVTNGVFEKNEEKTWKFDESNNISIALNTFYNSILKNNNEENIAITKSVIEIMNLVQIDSVEDIL